MSKFHVNPNTGNTGTCKAKRSCPFGDLEKDHYDSKAEARAAYEKKMEKSFSTLKLPPNHEDRFGFSAKEVDKVSQRIKNAGFSLTQDDEDSLRDSMGIVYSRGYQYGQDMALNDQADGELNSAAIADETLARMNVDKNKLDKEARSQLQSVIINAFTDGEFHGERDS